MARYAKTAWGEHCVLSMLIPTRKKVSFFLGQKTDSQLCSCSVQLMPRSPIQTQPTISYSTLFNYLFIYLFI